MLRRGGIPFCMFTGAVLIVLRAAARGAESEASPENYRELSLPADPEAWRLVSSRSEAAPEPLRRLQADTGVPWLAVWDASLGTFEAAYPRGPLRLTGPSEPLGSADAVAEIAIGFLEKNRELLGIGPEGLSAVRVQDLGEGRLVSAVQVHAGLPVRGSALRILLDGRGQIRSFTARIGRGLPPLEAVRFSKEDEKAWMERAQALDGLAEVVEVIPQIVFPRGLASAVPAVLVAGLDAEGKEHQIFRKLSDGELLLRRETVAHFAEMPPRDPCDQSAAIWVKLKGHYPSPEDVYATPHDFAVDAEPNPVPGYYVQISASGECNFALNCLAEEDGQFRAGLESLTSSEPYQITIDFYDLGFRLHSRDPQYSKMQFESTGDFVFEKTFNTERSEWGAFQLFAYNHFHRCTLATAAVVKDQRLLYGWREEPKTCKVLLHSQYYEHSYFPHSGRFILGSKTGLEARDSIGRWEKIPATIIYHEWGHEFAYGLAGVTAHPHVVEGIADAFAAYVAGTSLLGYAYHGGPAAGLEDNLQPVSDAHARDIALDRGPAAYSGDARDAIAGALWELRTAFLGRDTANSGEGARLAWALLARWLASYRLGWPQDRWQGTIEFHPKLGLDLIEAARDLSPDPGKTDLDPSSMLHLISEILGRRNLYPTPFVRGDSSGDGACDISDAIQVLNYLFAVGEELPCREAADSNDDGTIDLSDPIRLLGHLFLGQEILPPPYPECAPDPGYRNGLGCGRAACAEF